MVYVFKEGYVRTSSEVFTIDKGQLDKPNVHLTNNAVQKNNENYGKFEEGNILSFSQMQGFIDEEQTDRQDWVKGEMMKKMKH